MSTKKKLYERFPISRRIEHWILVLSFITLAGTGLPQKYPNSPVSVAIVRALGGVENLYDIHHFMSVIVMLAVIYHLLTIAYHVFVLRSKWSMMISLQDIKDALQVLLYNLRISKSAPKMGRYTFDEKFEYWAFVWGYSIMGITGFIMWNPITATRYLPGEFVPAAKAAHGGEAVLAVLAILVWHMYHVGIRRSAKLMVTGMQTEEEMQDEHPLELEEIKSGVANRRPDAQTIRKRQLVFFPVAALMTILMLTGVYRYITAEETALTTISPISTTAESPIQNPQP
ncbi:MAG TPA: cytochrome b/b6 domain-containing protein [Anaerolineales bacterium]|nr:cytochrome b/b6 domain-containing protein [Anaerolineales bacterium]